ncbi:MAG: amino acid adenylation domain-containing protein, partial [bacterium]|nr:amino acid adenylation domain-containing protein [bacterium]
EKFWLRELAGEIPVLDLPMDYARPSIQGFEGKHLSFDLDNQKTNGLKKLAIGKEVTLFMLLLTIYNILLSKLCGKEDIIVGTPTSGRRHADLGLIMGMFVNTLALRNHPKREKTFLQFLQEVKEKTLQSFENQDYPFHELVEHLINDRDTSRNPLFDVVFVLQNTQQHPFIDIPGLTMKPIEWGTGTAKFDLTLIAVETPDHLKLTLEYSTKLFKTETAQRFANYFKTLVSHLSTNPGVNISELEIISDEEKQQILVDFNNTKREYPANDTIHQLFQNQVKQTPDQVALVGQTTNYDAQITNNDHLSVSYNQLDGITDRLAQYLMEKGVESGTIVAIMLPRSLEMVIGILGVLKSGGAYLPIDPDYPEERINYMLRDSGAKVLFSTRALAEDKWEIATIFVNPMEHLPGSPDHDQPLNFSTSLPTDLAYVIYTSGSTGKPKGVMLQHQGILSLKAFHQYSFNVGDRDRIIQFASSSFDASVWEIFMALLNGAALYMLSSEIIGNYEIFEAYITRHRITIATLPPLYAGNLNPGKLKSIRMLITAGSAPTAASVHRWTERTRYINAYGPTETTICATVWDGNLQSDGLHVVPIGKPISNTQIYILDAGLSIQPIGVAGELCVSGIGIARGYLNRPELTMEKFEIRSSKLEVKPHHNFALRTSHFALYHTGDLARWLPDGNIEFMGRIDHQVKIRGFRIELGEIEHRLQDYHAIKDSLVMARETVDGENYLCAYVVPLGGDIPLDPSEPGELAPHRLREYLLKQLPEYMAPAYFVVLEKMPLDPNGKVDRKALPEPGTTVKTDRNYVPPSDRTEEQLVAIWAELLGRSPDHIGMHDNFFQLGGHSLKAVGLNARIHKDLSAEIPIARLFANPTIRGIRQLIDNTGKSLYSAILPVEERDYYPLSSAQRRLFIIHQLDPSGTTYNLPNVMQLIGALDKERFEEVFKALIKRHESLRTSLVTVDGQPVQRVHRDISFEILRSSPHDGARGNFIRPFDLSIAPLLRIGLSEISNEAHLLMFDMHHIISDGVSMSILVDEFMAFYKNKGSDLPPLNLRYKDYALWQNNRAHSPMIKEQEEWWLNQMAGDIPVLEIPVDFSRPAIKSPEGHQLAFDLEPGTSARLRTLTHETGTTPFMLLLAIFNLLLSKISGQQDIIVGTPTAGRPHSDLEPIIGVFINTLGLRNFLIPDKQFIEFLDEVKENSLQAFHHQDYQFEDLVETVVTRRDLSRNALFDVMLTLQNIDSRELEIPGLTLSPYPYETVNSKFDLTLTALEDADRFLFSFNYSTTLFKQETIERFINYFKQLTDTLTADSRQRLSQVELLSVAEKRQILEDFNNTPADYPAHQTIHQIFEDQVERTPDNIAIVSPGNGFTASISYGELNDRSNRLAQRLQENGVKPGTIAGIMVPRSLAVFTGILGILKAGAAYLPIDPAYPEERINYMLRDSGAKVIVTNGLKVNRLDGLMVIKPGNANEFPNQHTNKPTNQQTNLAYVIYTSGSTGHPKGVMVDHASALNVLSDLYRTYPFRESDVYLLKTALVFDVSVSELFGWFWGGGRLAILEPGGEQDPAAISSAIMRLGVTHINFVPSMFNVFVDLLKSEITDRISGLNYIFLAGEALLPGLMEKSRYLNGKITLENLYGPTEATVYASRYSLSDWTGKGSIPIGKPLQNTRLYILDKGGNPQPIGIPGELCISGAGVARGYLNRPELTAERFINSKLQSINYKQITNSKSQIPNKTSAPSAVNSIIYKTGDLAKWLTDGNIEFLGRIDHQVKIRGFRVEPGEIENHLLKYEKVKEASVL